MILHPLTANEIVNQINADRLRSAMRRQAAIPARTLPDGAVVTGTVRRVTGQALLRSGAWLLGICPGDVRDLARA